MLTLTTTSTDTTVDIDEVIVVNERKNGAARLVKYLSLTEYRREVAASAVGFRLMSESSGGPLSPPSHRSPPSFRSPSFKYTIYFQEAGNALVGVRVSMGGDDRLFTAASQARSHLKYAIKKHFI
ncbi:hypothetical protein EVAR_6282_1 [Eumeta japonica]|uniref:Uncharacterized protein n=1 Tax=Eumeta variegata TaxID=151549 RepID=A0A4C1T9B5_EUMVA|nr:hypothetical protein EVAR_6282_1 [Eumeta japonica]